MHVDEQYHISRKASINGKFKLEYFPTTEPIADILTKPLGLQKLPRLRKLILSMESQPSAEDNWNSAVAQGGM